MALYTSYSLEASIKIPKLLKNFNIFILEFAFIAYLVTQPKALGKFKNSFADFSNSFSE